MGTLSTNFQGSHLCSEYVFCSAFANELPNDFAMNIPPSLLRTVLISILYQSLNCLIPRSKARSWKNFLLFAHKVSAELEISLCIRLLESLFRSQSCFG